MSTRAARKTILARPADETAEARLERFIQMAAKDGLRAHQVVKGDYSAFTVHSVSGTWYTVTWDENHLQWVCKERDTNVLCKGYQYGGLCRHIGCIEARIRREVKPEEPDAQPEPQPEVKPELTREEKLARAAAALNDLFGC